MFIHCHPSLDGLLVRQAKIHFEERFTSVELLTEKLDLVATK